MHVKLKVNGATVPCAITNYHRLVIERLLRVAELKRGYMTHCGVDVCVKSPHNMQQENWKRKKCATKELAIRGWFLQQALNAKVRTPSPSGGDVDYGR